MQDACASALVCTLGNSGHKLARANSTRRRCVTPARGLSFSTDAKHNAILRVTCPQRLSVRLTIKHATWTRASSHESGSSNTHNVDVFNKAMAG